MQIANKKMGDQNTKFNEDSFFKELEKTRRDEEDKMRRRSSYKVKGEKPLVSLTSRTLLPPPSEQQNFLYFNQSFEWPESWKTSDVLAHMPRSMPTSDFTDRDYPTSTKIAGEIEAKTDERFLENRIHMVYSILQNFWQICQGRNGLYRLRSLEKRRLPEYDLVDMLVRAYHYTPKNKTPNFQRRREFFDRIASFDPTFNLAVRYRDYTSMFLKK